MAQPFIQITDEMLKIKALLALNAAEALNKISYFLSNHPLRKRHWFLVLVVENPNLLGSKVPHTRRGDRHGSHFQFEGKESSYVNQGNARHLVRLKSLLETSAMKWLLR